MGEGGEAGERDRERGRQIERGEDEQRWAEEVRERVPKQSFAPQMTRGQGW